MNTKEFLDLVEVVKKQRAKEDKVKSKMITILAKAGLQEEDLPQNADQDFSVKRILQGSENAYAAIQTLDVEYQRIGQYICFKVEEEETEDLYFISPIEVLYLENGCLSMF